MKVNIQDVLQFIQNEEKVELAGDLNRNVEGFSASHNPQPGTITWVKTLDHAKKMMDLKPEEMCIVAPRCIADEVISKKYGFKNSWIFCKDPKRTFFSALEQFFAPKKEAKEFRGGSSVILTASIGEDVSIGHQCYIGEEVEIADRVVIHNNVVIEGNVRIGEGSIIHSGTVIGTDGFGYYEDDKGTLIKAVHYGGVQIGQNVEIGSNTCIDRGTLEDTVICDNVKIDNLCHIAHNCRIEENSMVIALSMLGGSEVLRKGAYIAPGVLIKNQVIVGEDALVGMGAVVTKNVDVNDVVAGVPAKVLRKNV